MLHLTANMGILSLLPSDFGYVIFTYLYSWVMLTYLAVKVGSARKKFDVKVMWTLRNVLGSFMLCLWLISYCLICSIPQCTATRTRCLTASREPTRIPWRCIPSGLCFRLSQLLSTRFVLTNDTYPHWDHFFIVLFWLVNGFDCSQVWLGRVGGASRPGALWHK